MERVKILSLILCASSSSFATVWTVDDDGKADFNSIQAAIDASSDGDFISVQEGIYYETINFQGKAITVKGVNVENTIIDGSFTVGSVVTFDSGETNLSVLSQLWIRGGSGTYWTDPIFGSQLCGGGIFCDQSSPMIQLCNITDNTAWGGGGLFVTDGDPYIIFCKCINNEAAGYGGGFYLNNHVNAIIDLCDISNNIASWGGGMTCMMQSDPQILNCSFNENITYNVGGGIYIRSSSSPDVFSSEFNNNVQISNPLGSGGGACIYGGSNGGEPCYPTFTFCSFENNSVQGDGGGMAAAYDAHPKLTECYFGSNHAGRSGGGLACVADSDHLFSSTAEVDGCTIESNTADEEGGGIHVRFSDPIISSTSVIGNIATITGGGINFFDSPDAWLSNSVLCGNMPNAVEGIYSDGGGNSISNSCTVCEGDVNGDDVVNVTDLLAVVGNWGPCEGCNVDINNDGFVNVTDLLIVVGNWGPCL